MPIVQSDSSTPLQEGLLPRLWIYTNYDCNLSCSYCVAESYVGAQRKGLALEQVKEAMKGASDRFTLV